MRSILNSLMKQIRGNVGRNSFYSGSAVFQRDDSHGRQLCESGLMNHLWLLGVILGANIGTTVTGQLIAFNLSDVAPLFVIIGVVMFMFCNKQNVKKIGVVILGFGILFMGLSTMSGAMSSFKESPEVVSLLGSLTNPLMAILVGFMITAILQSSSATVGIVILMASQGLLAFPILLF